MVSSPPPVFTTTARIPEAVRVVPSIVAVTVPAPSSVTATAFAPPSPVTIMTPANTEICPAGQSLPSRSSHPNFARRLELFLMFCPPEGDVWTWTRAPTYYRGRERRIQKSAGGRPAGAKPLSPHGFRILNTGTL